MSRGYLVANDKRIDLKHDETTIGRLSSNLIPINDPTISKYHASIHHFQSKFYLVDLNTVNGTFLNGTKLQPGKKQPIKHKDAIQFGKHVQLYHFYESDPQPEKKGKINLKDYCFQLDSQEDQLSLSVSMPQKQGQSTRKVSKGPAETAKSGWNVNTGASKPTGKAVKIPQLADYLELQASLLSSNPSMEANKFKASKFGREPKVNLPTINNDFDEEELKKVRKEEERRKNIYLEEQADRLAREQKTRALEEEKIRLEIERHKQQEQMLRKQIEHEQRVKQQQARIDDQKRRIEDQLLRREQERRQREQQAEREQQQKQKRFVEQLQQEKQQELQQIREQQEHLRTKSQQAMKQQLESRKRQLELQAQALASQYEQIYKDTIRKMKNDIEKQESEIAYLERNIEQAKEQKAEMELKVKQVGQAVEMTEKQYQQISGRNKAFILYASELQNRLDGVKQNRKSSVKKGSPKLREQIDSSRRLLSMKKGQLKALEEQISKLRISLNMDKRLSRSDMLESIISNHQQIQRSKYLYFEYLREQKSLQELWEISLEENDHLEQQNISLEKEASNYRKELGNNMRDNAVRMTQQRLHMLKCLHYIPEDKKRAAKLLIQEMVTMEDEIRGMTAESEQVHEKINSFIIGSSRLKSQNEYLSELLFGADSTAHHFDNMKIQINDLMDRISMERDEGRVQKRLKLAEEVEYNQMKIYQSSRKLESLKNRWRQGLRGQKGLLAQKNPIVFFGDLLAKKEAELQNYEHRSAQLERQLAEISVSVQELSRKKGQLADSLQGFKREELAKVRQTLL